MLIHIRCARTPNLCILKKFNLDEIEKCKSLQPQNDLGNEHQIIFHSQSIVMLTLSEWRQRGLARFFAGLVRDFCSCSIFVDFERILQVKCLI